MKKKRIIIIIIAVLIVAVAAGTGGYLYLKQYIPAIEVKSSDDSEIAGWTMDKQGAVRISGEGELPDLYRHYAVHDASQSDLLKRWADAVNPGFHAKKIEIGEDVRDYSDERKIYNGGALFWNCNEVSAIEAAEGSPCFSSEDGVLFNKDRTVLLRYPAGNARVSYTVPDGVKEIRGGAFADCLYLEELILPEGVEKTGSDAFLGMEALKSLSIPASLTDDSDISGMPALERITVAEGNAVYTVRDGMLLTKDQKTILLCPPCSGLTECEVTGSVETIADWAFSGCKDLVSVNIGGNVTKIGDYAFQGCPALKTVTIPGSVKKIANSAFNGCSSLELAAIGDGVKNIGYCAFYDCKNLKTVTIPDSVTEIDDDALGFYAGKSDEKKVPGFTIVCSSEASAAKRYAEKNGFAIEIG